MLIVRMPVSRSCWLYLSIVAALSWLSLPAASGGGAEEVAAPASSAVDDADEADDEAAEPAPRREPPGERPFWTAVQWLSTDDAEKQNDGREKLIEAGDLEFVPAQTYLGECYLRGQDGFSKNPRKAVAWFRLAADRGDPIAKIYLSTCYILGTGVRADRAKAKALLEEIVAATGKYAPPSPPLWFLEAQQAARKDVADRNDPVALGARTPPWEILIARGHFILGTLRDEDGDHAGALALYDAAASWGPGGRAALYEAVLRAARARALGRGCTRDLAKANQLLERSRELLHANAMAELHTMWTNRKVDDFALADLEKVTGEMAKAQMAKEQQGVTASLLKENPVEALRWCEMSAKTGEVWAMLELADILRLGRAGSPDTQAAFQWYSRAQEAGDSWVAVANLVVCHLRGVGTPVDRAAAEALVRRHGDANFASALAGAGLAPQDTWGATDWHALLGQQARVAKLPLARYHAARVDFDRLMQEGERSKVRPKDVLRAMRRAAEEGFAGAHYYTAQLLRQGVESFPGRTKVEPELERGAQKGDLACMIEFAIILAKREGNMNLRRSIEMNQAVIARDPENASAYNNLAVDIAAMGQRGIQIGDITDMDGQAIKYLEKSAELGSWMAARNLAQRYMGGIGVPKDPKMAYTYFQTAAEKGDAESNRILGQMHEKGIGVPVTPREAMYYYRLAALDGDVEALKSVCNLYLQGRGVDRDLDAAKGWLLRLAASGNAMGLLQFGDVLMTQKEYGEARRLWLNVNESPLVFVAGVANHRLAKIYREGLGVKANPRRAAKFHKKALELQNADAICFDCRQLIVAGKSAEAVRTLERLSGRSPEAMYLLGSVRLAGQGVPKDVPAGIKNLREAAKTGHLESKYLLAVATVEKLQGAPTPDEAIQLLEEAESAGLAKARELKPKVESMQSKTAATPVIDAGRSGSG